MTVDGWAYPDVCLGTDSHTTMVNGLGVLAWGIGGVEAEARMLGQPLPMLCRRGRRPSVRRAPEGATATDLVLTIAEPLRRTASSVSSSSSPVRPSPRHARPPGDDHNMSPEFGATTG